MSVRLGHSLRQALATSPAALARYGCEAWLVLLLMLAIASAVMIFEHPASWPRQLLDDPLMRRAALGTTIGAVVVALTYSPWGSRSGAHLNPAITLAMARAGRHRPDEILGYILAQVLGALAGMGVVSALARPLLAHPQVSHATTTFAPEAWAAAFAAEATVTFLLMSLILACARSPRWRPWGGVLCGLAVIAFVVAVAPISGISMNPARTFAAAVVAGDLGGLWLYVLAPPVGTCLAAELQGRLLARGAA